MGLSARWSHLWERGEVWYQFWQAQPYQGGTPGTATSTGTEVGATARLGTISGTDTATGTAAGGSQRTGTVTGASISTGAETGAAGFRGTVTGFATAFGSEVGAARFAGSLTGTRHRCGEFSRAGSAAWVHARRGFGGRSGRRHSRRGAHRHDDGDHDFHWHGDRRGKRVHR